MPTISSRRRSIILKTALIACAALVPSRVIAQRPLGLSPDAAYARLDSLERVAVGTGSFAERLSAVSTITRIGVGPTGCDEAAQTAPIKYPGLVARMRSVYRQTADLSLKHAIVVQMTMHRECDEVVRFLAEVAGEYVPVGGDLAYGDDQPSSPQSMAIGILSELGQPGETALRLLRASGSVREPRARRALEEIERRGYRRRPR